MPQARGSQTTCSEQVDPTRIHAKDPFKPGTGSGNTRRTWPGSGKGLLCYPVNFKLLRAFAGLLGAVRAVC